MPKYRQLHLKILDSDDFANMPDDFTRVCWMLLILIVDSEGRGIYNPAWIRSKMFPLRPDVSLESITTSFEWFAQQSMIVIYMARGKYYFYLPTFKEYQSGLDREGKSVLPAPEELPTGSGGNPEEVLHSVSALDSVFVSVSECVKSNKLFEFYQYWLEKITGLPQAGEGAVKTIRDLMEFRPEHEDMQAGYEWLKSEKRTVRYWNQLVGPSRTAQSKRLNPSSNGHKGEPEPEYRKDAQGRVWKI